MFSETPWRGKNPSNSSSNILIGSSTSAKMSPARYAEEMISDEEYLVLQARSCQESDPCAAKAWLITAKTLFPRNFGIQFEVYNNEKAAKNTREAAKFLEDLFRDFKTEQGLWKEMHAIMEALQTEIVDSASCFLRDVFAMLPIEVQHQMLLSIADRTEDTREHCTVLLLLLKKFPDKISLHGTKLVDTLLMAEKHSLHHTPVNCFRKLLVYDILPLILKSPGVDFPPKSLFRLLNKCIEFYITYIIQPQDGSAPGASISGLQESEASIDAPWEELANVMNALGNKLGWELKDLFVTSGNKEFLWQRIHTFYQNLPVESEESFHGLKQVFFFCSVLFLQCLYEYNSKADPEQFTSGKAQNSSTSVPSLILIEGFRNSSENGEQTKLKKKRLELEIREEGIPNILMSKAIPATQAPLIIQSFVTSIKCWELLHCNDALEKDFKRLCQQLRMNNWPWFLNFQLDFYVYQGSYQEAIAKLQQIESFVSPAFQNRVSLRIATCYFSLGNHSIACERVLSVVSALPKQATSSFGGMPNSLNRTGRQLIFLNYTRQEVLQYCVKLILTCFKEKILHPGIENDLALGHLLVLLQFDWPHTEPLFTRVIEKIREQGKFSYNLFFNYIINVDILEEFAYLATPGGGNVTLDLLQVSTAQIAKQRAITRGVNKGAKEDFRSAMERQVGRCEESLDQLLIQFLTQEREVLQL